MKSENKIQKLLYDLGISPSLRGFKLICDAVDMLIKNNDEYTPVMDIYRYVACKNNTTYIKAERNIRHALSKIDFEREITKECSLKKNRTNGECLYVLALKIKEEGIGEPNESIN